MENEILYLSLKNKICEKIFTGIYKEGENLPPERVLAEDFNVSRVTVRKSLDLLEKDGIVERVQGSGTKVILQEIGHEGTTDIIALLAPAQNPFFSSFVVHFQKYAELNDSLVLFKQNILDDRMEDNLFKLFQKNIRNVVIWLEGIKLDSLYIRRLRGLGMNMVLIDIIIPTPYADCISLDNRDAITSLYNFLKGKGISKIGYVGWDNFILSSVREREGYFLELNPTGTIPYHIPWAEKVNLMALMEKYYKELKRNNNFPNGIICGDGELGIALKKIFLKHGLKNIPVVSIDDYPETKDLSMSVYRQPFDEFTQSVYQCLLEQNKNAKQWKASVNLIKGKIIER
jgi:DNA-binding LacI/PurR family transcriptional regulator